MAEMKPFTMNAVATLRIGETEFTRTAKLTLPLAMKWEKGTAVATLSADTDGFLKHIAALQEWFVDFPDEPADG